MNDTTEPAPAGQQRSALPAGAHISASRPDPFGILRTFGWAILASIAGLLSAAAFFLATVKSPWAPRNEIEDMPFVWVAATIATVAFFAVIVRACRRRGWRAADYLGLARPQGRYVRASLIAFLLALAVSTVASRFGPLMDDRNSLWPLLSPVLFFLEVAVMAPITEELFFRGFLYRGLAASRLGITGAILVTSFLWAVPHTDRTWLGFVDIFLSGVVLGWLRWRSDSTITPIAVHGVNNFISSLAYLLSA